MLDRAAALLAIDADHAGDCLTEQVEAWALRVGAGLTERAHGAVDQLRVDLLHGLVAKAQTVHDAGTEAFNQNVCVSGKLLAHFDCAWILQIHDDGLLAAVDPGVGHALALDKRGVGSCGVTGLRLDLDDLRAEVGGDRAGAGAGYVGRKVQNFHIVEHFHSCFLLLLDFFRSGPVTRARQC